MKTVGGQKFTQIRLDITFDEHRSTSLLNIYDYKSLEINTSTKLVP